MTNKIIKIVVLFLLFTSTLNSQETDFWNIAVRMPDGSAYCEDVYIVRHFMLSLKQEIAECPDHYIIANDMWQRIYHRQQTELNDIRSQIAVLTEQRNQVLFNDGTAQEKRNINNQIEELNDELTSSNFEIESDDNITLPIQFTNPDSDNMIYSSNMAVEQSLLIEDKIDMIISGDVQQIEDSYLIDIWVYDVNLDKKNVLWQGSFSIFDIDDTITLIADALRTTILGRDWAALEVETDQSDALIYYNGILLGTQNCKTSILYPGEGTLDIYSSGYLTQSHVISLEKNSTIFKEYQLQIDENSLVYIDSIPQGAEVYLGSIYLGLTPIEVVKPEEELRLTLILDGYETINSSISPFVESNYSFEMIPFTVNYSEQARIEKKRFYNSVAWFAISVGVTIVMAGIYQFYADEYNYNVGMANLVGSGDSMYPTYVSNSQRSLNNYYWSYSSFWGSIGLNLGLLGITVLNLSDYLKTAEKSLDH